MPAVKRPMASVFCGASTEVKVRTQEWMSFGRISEQVANEMIESKMQ
jgi:hypothetical protein